MKNTQEACSATGPASPGQPFGLPVAADEAKAEGTLSEQRELLRRTLASFGAVRRQTARALEASEVRYRRLFQTAQDAILILDGDTGKNVDSNPFLRDLLGYSPDELLGKELWEIDLFKDIEASRAAFTASAARKAPRGSMLGGSPSRGD